MASGHHTLSEGDLRAVHIANELSASRFFEPVLAKDNNEAPALHSHVREAILLMEREGYWDERPKWSL